MRSSSRSFATLAAATLVATVAACSSMQGPTDTATTETTTAPAPTPLVSSDVPAAIAVPSSSRLAFTLKGSGLLNYECRAGADGPRTYDWVLTAPDAVLRDANDAIVGKYSGGPTWEHGDGSKVTGRQLAIVPAPTAGNLPWQLVQAATTSGSGAFGGVTYIQRVDTNAGVAPSDSCAAGGTGAKRQVRYSAEYRFFKG